MLIEIGSAYVCVHRDNTNTWHSVLVKARLQSRSTGRCFWLAQLCGGCSRERMEKSKSGLMPAGKGAASCAAFLVGGFATALPFNKSLLTTCVTGNCLRNLIRYYAGVDIGDIS